MVASIINIGVSWSPATESAGCFVLPMVRRKTQDGNPGKPILLLCESGLQGSKMFETRFVHVIP